LVLAVAAPGLMVMTAFVAVLLLVSVFPVAGGALTHAPGTALTHAPGTAQASSGLRPAVYSGPTISAQSSAPTCTASSNNPTTAVTLSTTAGDLIYVVIGNDVNPSTIPSVNDSQSNAYAVQENFQPYGSGHTVGLFDVLATAGTTGTDTITATTSSGEQTELFAFDVAGSAGIQSSAFGGTQDPSFAVKTSLAVTAGASVPANSLVFETVLAFGGTNLAFTATTGTATYGATDACSTDLTVNGQYDQNLTAGTPAEVVSFASASVGAGGFLEVFVPVHPPPPPICGSSVTGNISSGPLTLPALYVPVAHDTVLVAIASQDNTATIPPPSDGVNTYTVLTLSNNTALVTWVGGSEMFASTGGSFYSMAVYMTEPATVGNLHITVDTGADVTAIAWAMCRIISTPDFASFGDAFTGDAGSGPATSYNNESVVSLTFAKMGTVDWSKNVNASRINDTHSTAGDLMILGGVYDTGAAINSVPITINLSAHATDWEIDSFSLYDAPPLPPTSVTVTGVGVTTATVNWIQPTHDENNNVTIIVNDTVQLHVGSACSGGVLNIGVFGTSYGLSGLAPNVEFSVDVTAWNSFGQSNISACVQFTTLASIPPTLVLSDVTPTTFTESWTNGTWGNVTEVKLIIANDSATCQSAGALSSSWTWAVSVGPAVWIQQTGGIVAYEFNDSQTLNFTFNPFWHVWVGLWYETSGSFANVTTCQQVAFAQYPPPPPGPDLNIFPFIIAGLCGGIILIAVTQAKKNKQWWG